MEHSDVIQYVMTDHFTRMSSTLIDRMAQEEPIYAVYTAEFLAYVVPEYSVLYICRDSIFPSHDTCRLIFSRLFSVHRSDI
jgi:hypothetical protein